MLVNVKTILLILVICSGSRGGVDSITRMLAPPLGPPSTIMGRFSETSEFGKNVAYVEIQRDGWSSICKMSSAGRAGLVGVDVARHWWRFILQS